MKTLLIAISCFASLLAVAQPTIQLETFATAVPYNPIGLVNCNDDRVFAICQSGYMVIIDTDGVINPTPFLDIDDRVESLLNAHGLLGAVFHPDYASNGYFYVNYINNDMNTVISRFSVSIENPDSADAASELILMTVEQPYNVHKGGDMQFGPDGYLYFPLGDGGTIPGGGEGDPDNRAQNPNTFLGKMLRIDVNAGIPYAIPADNPYIGATDTLHELWAIGLRNPWRFSFDKLTGDMWLSDVGQDLWEEINFEPAGFAGGNNYGWRCYEANEIYNPDSCDGAVDFTYPIYTYPHNDSTGGYSITGGYVYRGSLYPDLYGKYIYCDYVTGNFYTLTSDGAGGWINNIYPALLLEVVSFGEDKNAELYVVVRATSTIYKLKDVCESLTSTNILTDADCTLGNIGSINLSIVGGTEPYAIEWSTGDTTAMLDSLAAGVYEVSITDAFGCSSTSSYIINMSGEYTSGYTISGDTIYVELAAGDTYSWYLDGILLNDATTGIYFPTVDGVYTIIVTNLYGCADTLTYNYFPVNIDAIANTAALTIVPNPASNYFAISNLSTNLASATIQIFNMYGELVQTANGNATFISIQHIPNGIYYISVSGMSELFQIIKSE